MTWSINDNYEVKNQGNVVILKDALKNANGELYSIRLTPLNGAQFGDFRNSVRRIQQIHAELAPILGLNVATYQAGPREAVTIGRQEATSETAKKMQEVGQLLFSAKPAVSLQTNIVAVRRTLEQTAEEVAKVSTGAFFKSLLYRYPSNADTTEVTEAVSTLVKRLTDASVTEKEAKNEQELLAWFQEMCEAVRYKHSDLKRKEIAYYVVQLFPPCAGVGDTIKISEALAGNDKLWAF